tara:strand:+ start:1157 stop:1591 length:435 start_codon:yes stop_codon:yes gene_type:complete
MESVMVVCGVFTLLKRGTKYTKEGKQLERKSIALPREYVENKNSNWEMNGLWHEIDEDATENFYKLREELRLSKIKDNKVKDSIKDLLADVIVQGAETVVSKKDPKTESPELKKARADYKEAFEKNAFHKWGVEELNKKINEKK